MARLAQVNLTSPSTVFPGPTNPNLAADVVNRFILYAIGLSGMIFLTQLIIAGYGYMTSVGDPGKLQIATRRLTNAILGLIITLVAFFIMQILQALFGLQGTALQSVNNPAPPGCNAPNYCSAVCSSGNWTLDICPQGQPYVCCIP